MGLEYSCIDERSKVMLLIKYLGITLYEFRRKFGITVNVFDSILLNESKIPLRSRIKIMKFHPEISKVWLELGTGSMTSGLIPNNNLRRLLMELSGLDNLDDLIDSKFIRFLCRGCHMDIHEMKMILNDKVQISYPQAKRIGSELGLNPYRVLSMYELDLDYDKDKVDEFFKRLKAFKDKKVQSKYDPRERKGNIGTKSPIYYYLKGKVDEKFLNPTSLNKELNTYSGRSILYINKTISRFTANALCNRFNLDFNDMKNSGIIQDYKPDLKSLNSDFYKLIKGMIDSTDSVSNVSRKIGISPGVFLSHLNGKRNISARSAIKYYRYFRIDFTSVVSDREKTMYADEVNLIKLCENFKASQKAAKP